jgi:hypothetical protein
VGKLSQKEECGMARKRPTIFTAILVVTLAVIIVSAVILVINSFEDEPLCPFPPCIGASDQG